MTEDCCIPRIKTEFDFPTENSNNGFYRDVIYNNLKKILPNKFFDVDWNDPEVVEDQKEYLNSLLPLTHFVPCISAPSTLSLYLLARLRPNAFKFFFEMVSRWLIPGKRLNVIMLYASDFTFPDIGDDVYTLCEVKIQVENVADLEEITRNLPIIETEVCLGVESSYYARRILEVKGLSNDEKTAMIQEYIAYIVARLPKEFNYDVFTEMQHLLVMCQDEFKAKREVRHLSRIICVQYLFRNALRESVKKAPEKRHLSLKLFKAKLSLNDEKKSVLGVLVGLNFLSDKEIFEEAHLIKAIQNYIPAAKSIENSFFFNRRGNENVGTLYLEIEKSNAEEFTGEEICILRKELPTDLEGRIEHMMHPVFMPRNEEEIMRNILSLSNQIKYLRDIPQMFVSFDEQTHLHLFFTIILVRVMKPGSESIQQMFNRSDTILEYIHDRCKTVGYLRKKYRKEVTVFRIKVPKEQFLRRDHSIDLYKARQAVVSEISTVVGEVRDFNGGMISKQNELLCAIRNLLSDSVKYNDLLLENFFYSLNPVIMRTVLEPETLKKLFLMLLEAISEGFFKDESYSMNVRAEPNFIFVMIAADDREVEKMVIRTLTQMNINSSALATSCVTVYDNPYIGYIYRCDDPLKQRQFCVAIQNTIESLQHQKYASAL